MQWLNQSPSPLGCLRLGQGKGLESAHARCGNSLPCACSNALSSHQPWVPLCCEEATCQCHTVRRHSHRYPVTVSTLKAHECLTKLLLRVCLPPLALITVFHMRCSLHPHHQLALVPSIRKHQATNRL